MFRRKPKPMTPEEFAAHMRRIDDGGDEKVAHYAADRLISGLLRDLGYEEGARVYDDACSDWWYA